MCVCPMENGAMALATIQTRKIILIEKNNERKNEPTEANIVCMKRTARSHATCTSKRVTNLFFSLTHSLAGMISKQQQHRLWSQHRIGYEEEQQKYYYNNIVDIQKVQKKKKIPKLYEDGIAWLAFCVLRVYIAK